MSAIDHKKLFKQIQADARKCDLKTQDPWYRFYEWKTHPYFSKTNQLKKAFPGLGIATVAFGLYCIYDEFIVKKNSGHKAH